MLQQLTPISDPLFSDFSYDFRPGRSAHQAVEMARAHVVAGHRWCVELDLEKFFDRVNHDILMAHVQRHIEDKRVLKLIRRYFEAGVMSGGIVSQRQEGTPQCGPLSPLLSNILLNELDLELERRGHRFLRYADDANIYVRSRRAGERVMAGVVELGSVTYESGVAEEAVGSTRFGLDTGYDKPASPCNMNRRIRNRTYGGVRGRRM